MVNDKIKPKKCNCCLSVIRGKMAVFPDAIIFVLITAIILVAMKIVGKTLRIILWIILLLFALAWIMGPERILMLL